MTEDTLLGGRIAFRQPTDGYRAGIDPVFLAAAVPAATGERILDVGCGAGAAALCLAARVAGSQVTGIEFNRDLVRLAVSNARASNLADRVEFYAGDLRQPPIRLAPASFDHVMANPPYMAPGEGRLPTDAGRARAMVESEAKLEDWMRSCLMMTRPKGSVTVIHRADRLGELLAMLSGRLGGVTIFPLWTSADATRPAKRVIVSGRTASNAPLSLLPGLLLHGPDGRYTPSAEKILRNGGALTDSAAPEGEVNTARP